MVKDMGLDDAMEEPTADEAKLTIDGCSSTTSIGPALWSIVGQGRVGMLEESDGNYDAY